MRPDAYKLDDNGFISEIRELKPDTTTGKNASGMQLAKYGSHAREFNESLARETGLRAPKVQLISDWYTP